MKIKVIIAGGRHFNDYELLKAKCAYYFSNYDSVEIVSGCARGADSLGERFAKEFNHPIKLFPADWEGLGKSAGYIRNAQMAEYADALIAFWDGKSKGTSHMIRLSESNHLKVRVVRY